MHIIHPLIFITFIFSLKKWTRLFSWSMLSSRRPGSRKESSGNCLRSSAGPFMKKTPSIDFQYGVTDYSNGIITNGPVTKDWCKDRQPGLGAGKKEFEIFRIGRCLIFQTAIFQKKQRYRNPADYCARFPCERVSCRQMATGYVSNHLRSVFQVRRKRQERRQPSTTIPISRPKKKNL